MYNCIYLLGVFIICEQFGHDVPFTDVIGYYVFAAALDIVNQFKN